MSHSGHMQVVVIWRGMTHWLSVLIVLIVLSVLIVLIVLSVLIVLIVLVVPNNSDRNNGFQ